jgi:APA family basic amino acid/polyamine antiporter
MRVAERAMTAVVGPLGAPVVAAIVCLSTLGCNMSAVLAVSRAGYAMAVDGMFFRFAARVHPKYRTPDGALLGLALWSCALTLSGSYEQLFTYVMFAAVLFNVLAGLAIFRLRRTHAHLARPYRTWGYPVVPLVFVLGSLFLVVNTLLERPAESLAGLLLIVAGLPAYGYWRRRRVPR